jgi:hypothetical protein
MEGQYAFSLEQRGKEFPMPWNRTVVGFQLKVIKFSGVIRSNMRTMRILGAVIIVPCFSILLFSQVATQTPQPSKPAEDNLYCRALLATMDARYKLDVEFNARAKEKRPAADFRRFILGKYDSITDELPTQYGEYQLEILDRAGLKARFQKLKSEFPILVVYPTSNEGTRLRVHFDLFYISFKHDVLNMGLSEWSNVFFRFDCEKKAYVIDEVQLGGI